MKPKFIALTALLLLASANTTLFAQGFRNVGSAGANFLQIPVDAAGAALGNALVGHAQGVEGLYWNPGALGFSEQPELMLSTVDWIADSRVSFIGATFPLGRGVLGASLTALTMDDMEITTEAQPNGTGTFFSAGSYGVSLAYGLKVIDRFSFGLAVKYVYEYIWETNGSTLAFDLGSVYVTNFHHMRIGMRLANFGGNVVFGGTPIDNKPADIAQTGLSFINDPRLDRVSKDYPLPQLFNAGIAIDPIHSEDDRLTLMLAANDPVDNDTQIETGVEYAYQDFLFLRGGYKSGFDEQNFSLGLGLRADLLGIGTRIDYAFGSLGRLGSAHIMTLRTAFAAP